MVVVYDIETLASCFTYTDINVETQEIKQFVIHKDRDDSCELYEHLCSLKGQIGFNNLNFDYPIIHYFMNWFPKAIANAKYAFLYDETPQEIITLLYNKAQEIIELQNNKTGFFKIVAIKESECFIKQLDLFKIWHYNNTARSTSLKALEISMNYPNVMEMPISHTREDIQLEEIPSILEYNLNDVLATYEFYKKTKEYGKIELRVGIYRDHNLPCMNWNNGKIGEELILKLYCEKTGKNYWDIKKLRTYRKEIHLADCIPSNISFNTPQFKKLLDTYKSTIITETKGSLNINVLYKGLKYVYGTGGLHAAIYSGIYESNEEYIIKSCDVASLYPNLPIVYEFYIEHLGIEFLEVYRDNIVQVRLNEKKKPKKDQNKSIVDGYKEAANIPYGKSNDENSFLYDPLYSMKTTIAGQLVITMLAERLSSIPNSQILMVNTDGLEIRIPRKHEDEYNNICRSWEYETKLVLEFIDYKKMWIGDINNYGCLSVDGKIKNKGRFEVDKVIGNEPAYHKDNSFRVVPLAIQEYFIHNTPIETTIRNHFINSYKENKNYGIYDFCGRQKFTKDSYGQTNELRYDSNGNPYNNIEAQQKNVRYYISNKGKSFIKRYNKGTSEVINKGFEVEIFNSYIDRTPEDYNINYQFYIKECYKEIEQIEPKQLSLF